MACWRGFAALAVLAVAADGAASEQLPPVPLPVLPHEHITPPVLTLPPPPPLVHPPLVPVAHYPEPIPGEHHYEPHITPHVIYVTAPPCPCPCTNTTTSTRRVPLVVPHGGFAKPPKVHAPKALEPAWGHFKTTTKTALKVEPKLVAPPGGFVRGPSKDVPNVKIDPHTGKGFGEKKTSTTTPAVTPPPLAAPKGGFKLPGNIPKVVVYVSTPPPAAATGPHVLLGKKAVAAKVLLRSQRPRAHELESPIKGFKAPPGSACDDRTKGMELHAPEDGFKAPPGSLPTQPPPAKSGGSPALKPKKPCVQPPSATAVIFKERELDSPGVGFKAPPGSLGTEPCRHKKDLTSPDGGFKAPPGSLPTPPPPAQVVAAPAKKPCKLLRG